MSIRPFQAAFLLSITAVGCSKPSATSDSQNKQTTQTTPSAVTPSSPGTKTSTSALKEDEVPLDVGKACGPQSPRDISNPAGTNTEPVRGGATPHLCNVHFHDPFEHAGFGPVPKHAGATGDPVCKSVEHGEQVEFHWVYTNCEPRSTPLKGLANCVCDREDLALRVFAQPYIVSDSGEAPTQPSDALVLYKGSTTGQAYDNQRCSPAHVNWKVSKTVKLVDKARLGAWCGNNPWIGEDHPHKSRALVTAPQWLSTM